MIDDSEMTPFYRMVQMPKSSKIIKCQMRCDGMFIRNESDIETSEVEEKGAKNAMIQWLIDEKVGAGNFLMRKFTLGRNGCTPLHSHDFEHEVFILDGNGKLIEGEESEREHELKKNDFAFIPPNEWHQFKNESSGKFVFLCLIPKK